jgi:chromosome segregation ATPase
VLGFHPGFNSIVGSTDSGKSAIYRSIFWVRFNKAVNFVSFWNRKKDGTPVDPSSVSLFTASTSITRERSQEMNGYRINDQDPLEAVGRGEPPEQVTKLLNISDINFFSQHNPPFLLTKSAGEVASILNDLIHLSDIDRVLSNADRIKRANKRELEQTTLSVSNLTKELSILSWVEGAKEALEQAEQVDIDLGDTESLIKAIAPAYEAYRQYEQSVRASESMCSTASTLIDQMNSIESELEEIVQKYAELERVASSLRKMEESIALLKALDVSEEIAAYDNIQTELDKVSDSIAEFTDWLRMYSAKEKMTKDLNTELSIVQKELEAIPVCSECGKPLEDCDD